ncbi:ODV-E66 [Urbanus proteus nucleopolyhedrovirus]|uniref:ODV-E66 n=1 Tax=Urbanus proteus nucleopolyhedrovirus TaxID=1675866 RepID=A0A162GUL6_9ABAC|nr:ODV-E66 [Urbanus proteus nucleopolyhedrovirus]AKR17354.2 ODV-E66 [Urbanus proteus nucleopolyhedrovirus]
MYNSKTINDQELAKRQLDEFDKFWISNIGELYKFYPNKILNPTLEFDKDTVFKDIKPFDNSHNFGIMLHNLIAYTVIYSENNNVTLRSNLIQSFYTVYDNIPKQITKRCKVLWGNQNDIEYFAIVLLEYIMYTCISLKKYIRQCEELCKNIFTIYINNANQALNCVFDDLRELRLALPYIYNQLLNLNSIDYMTVNNSALKQIVQKATFALVSQNEPGIRHDYVFVDKTNNRLYKNLINVYFTIFYYQQLFNNVKFNIKNVQKSLLTVGNNAGFIGPMLFDIQSTIYSPVLKDLYNYSDSSMFVTCELNNIINVANHPKYVGCLVGHNTHLPYLKTNNEHFTQISLWTMCKRIWNKKNNILPIPPSLYNFQSGCIYYIGLNNEFRSVTSTYTNFYLSSCDIAIVATSGSAAMYQKMNLQALQIKYESITIYFEKGMFQLYFNVSGPSLMLCCIISRETNLENNDEQWGAAATSVTQNGVVSQMESIKNYTPSQNFVLFRARSNVELYVQYSLGVACYSMHVIEEDSNYKKDLKYIDGYFYLELDNSLTIYKNNILMNHSNNEVCFSFTESSVLTFNVVDRFLHYTNFKRQNLVPESSVKLHNFQFIQTNQIKKSFLFYIL